MYIIKNAFRCIGRSKGRNILIGIIALVIAVSACLGLSIRQAAESAKQSALDELTVTATILEARKTPRLSRPLPLQSPKIWITPVSLMISLQNTPFLTTLYVSRAPIWAVCSS